MYTYFLIFTTKTITLYVHCLKITNVLRCSSKILINNKNIYHIHNSAFKLTKTNIKEFDLFDKNKNMLMTNFINEFPNYKDF